MARDLPDSERFLPLKPAVLLILVALAETSRHGYGIMLTVRQRSRGAVHLGTGHLYRHLKRLLDDGLAAEDPRARRPDDDPRRRYYRLTGLGRRVMDAEVARLADLVEHVRGLDAVSAAVPA